MLSTFLVSLVVAQSAGVSVSAAPSSISSTRRTTGGVFAPASLPAGTNAIYGFLGAPDVGAGYRQGFGLTEFEARAAFNVFKVSALAEIGFKLAVYEEGRLKIAPGLALGLEFNSGTRYLAAANFAYVGLRPRGTLAASYVFTDTISGIALFELPVSIAFTQGYQVTPLLGAGAEFHLGGGFSLLVSGHGGFDVSREPLGMPVTQGAWAARLGVGYRLF